MIELKVEEYCHDCPDFEADVIKSKESYENRYNPMTMQTEEHVFVRTTVHCAHANRCRAVKRYLEKKQKGE